MSVRAAVHSEMRQLASDWRLNLPPLTDDMLLLDSGLDSLAIATLVVRLEDVLGLDPFTQFSSEEAVYPVTLGAFVQMYERAAQVHGFHPASAD